MALFIKTKKDSGKIKEIKEVPFSLESELQTLADNNLQDIFGLDFVRSQFELHGLRIDTLAFDNDVNSFVIIEYKKDKHTSLVDQGLSYLSLMLNNKADFILEYAKKTKKSIDQIEREVDWTQSRVIFVARSFSLYQQNAANFKDFPIELYEVVRFENDQVLFNQILRQDTEATIKTITKDKQINKKLSELKTYTEEDLIPKGKESERLFKILKEKMQLINSDLVIHPTKLYLSYRLPDNWRNIICIWFRNDKLKIELLRSLPKDFDDPEKRTAYVNGSLEHYGQNISSIEVNNEKELDYAVFIIKQLYERFVKENN